MRDVKFLLLLLFVFSFALQLGAQPSDCTFKQPLITLHFATGNVDDITTDLLANYSRVSGSCPTDGHYAYTSYTSDCFRGDWHTLTEDHTPGDVDGNMLLVNAAPNSGTFLLTIIDGLKGGTIYEFGVWLMNLCRPTRKCPYPLLPKITIRLETEEGEKIAQFGTGELPRIETPYWTQYRAIFTTPPSMTVLRLIMIDNAPGGCGNDFALDDITFRECIKPPPVVAKAPKSAGTSPTKAAVVKKQPSTVKPTPKNASPTPAKKEAQISQVGNPTDSVSNTVSALKKTQNVFPPPPLMLTTRENSLVRKIDTEAGEIRIDLYDNGEIDGDTVSIYHNNTLIKSHARLSEKPISFRIAVDPAQPHHELVMVADNLGSIPPNTSVMIITAGSKRHEVFISSTEQKNAKVILELKK
jgi:hypothetical protein